MCRSTVPNPHTPIYTSHLPHPANLYQYSIYKVVCQVVPVCFYVVRVTVCRELHFEMVSRSDSIEEYSELYVTLHERSESGETSSYF